ncbi:Uncharacterised protein [Bordetella pertussis]|nr:Uncharacterised protein [Bordetella pertussis]
MPPRSSRSYSARVAKYCMRYSGLPCSSSRTRTPRAAACMRLLRN